MPHTKQAFDTLDTNVKWLRERAGDPKSLLYIGWRYDCSRWWHDRFCKELGIEKIGVLEIHPPNFQEFERQTKAGRYSARPILGDVRKIQEHVSSGEYDVIFWDHGPEHVSLDDLQKTTPLLVQTAGRLLLYCCPWGEWRQGADGGNEHEEHKNSVTKEQLIELGLRVVSMGGPSQAEYGELIAFRFLGEYSSDDFLGWR